MLSRIYNKNTHYLRLEEPQKLGTHKPSTAPGKHHTHTKNYFSSSEEAFRMFEPFWEWSPMGQNKKRTRKSSGQRRKPIQGNSATSTNAKKPHANNSSAKKSPANEASLAAHLEKFAKAVAEDHSHVEAAILAGRARGSASFLYRQLGVKDRIAEFLAIKKKENEEAVATSALRTRHADDIDDGEIRNLLADIGRSKTERSGDRIRALTALPKISRNKRPEDLKAHGWSANEIAELYATGRIPTRLLHLQGAGNAEAERVAAATCDAYTWVTEHTETYNEHWVEEKRPSPYEAFPRYSYLRNLFLIIDAEPITWIEKSRDMMISWACVAYLTLNAMRVPHRGVLFQTQKDDKVIQLVEYAKCLYRRQPQWLQDAYPLTKPIDQQPEHSLSFAAGGYVVGIPGGADQVRSYHPWGYLNDESSFQADAGECYNEAISAVKGKIIFNSSAGPGWYADARHDIIRNTED